MGNLTFTDKILQFITEWIGGIGWSLFLWSVGMTDEDYRQAIKEDVIREFESFHPRAVKLIQKRKGFIVIAEDEPYFLVAYGMIRQHEQSKRTWSAEDERIYQNTLDGYHLTIRHNQLIQQRGLTRQTPYDGRVQISQRYDPVLDLETWKKELEHQIDKGNEANAEYCRKKIEQLSTLPDSSNCHADRDGECSWDKCPQLRDNEPPDSGRHCPLDVRDPEW